MASINPLNPNSANCYALPYRPDLPFLISDIRALWRSALSARVPECQKLKMAGQACMALNTSKCNRTMTLGFKGLMVSLSQTCSGVARDRERSCNFYTPPMFSLRFYAAAIGAFAKVCLTNQFATTTTIAIREMRRLHQHYMHYYTQLLGSFLMSSGARSGHPKNSGWAK